MNVNLIKVTYEEIQRVVFSIHPTKAPGIDGFTGLFFQKFWNIIGNEVCAVIKNFFQQGIMPAGFNHTLISLIAKVQQVKSMKDLRPICLCTVFYKIIAKILINRLQPIMPLIISDEQSAFTKGRLISDNILLSHEIMHHLKTRHRSKYYGMAIKLDINKAYECVEWKYLQHVMQ